MISLNKLLLKLPKHSPPSRKVCSLKPRKPLVMMLCPKQIRMHTMLMRLLLELKKKLSSPNLRVLMDTLNLVAMTTVKLLLKPISSHGPRQSMNHAEPINQELLAERMRKSRKPKKQLVLVLILTITKQ